MLSPEQILSQRFAMHKEAGVIAEKIGTVFLENVKYIRFSHLNGDGVFKMPVKEFNSLYTRVDEHIFTDILIPIYNAAIVSGLIKCNPELASKGTFEVIRKCQ